MKKILVVLLCLSSYMTFAKVSEAEFEYISGSLSRIFDNEFSELSSSLKISLKRAPNDKPNAFAAKREQGIWEVTIISSLLNLEQLSPASLGMILCHEVGHFIGGTPYVVGRQLTAAVRARAPKKMSAEGQADYFASQICFKKLIQEVPEILNQIHFYPIDTVTKNECADENCAKAIHAAYETTLVYQELMRHLDVNENFSGHLNNEASERTLDYVGEYPTLDCRFETFVNGLTCNEDNCENRPICWFRD